MTSGVSSMSSSKAGKYAKKKPTLQKMKPTMLLSIDKILRKIKARQLYSLPHFKKQCRSKNPMSQYNSTIFWSKNYFTYLVIKIRQKTKQYRSRSMLPEYNLVSLVCGAIFSSRQRMLLHYNQIEMSYLALLSQIACFGALVVRSLQQIRKTTTTAQLFLNWQLLFVFSWLERLMLWFQQDPRYSLLAFFILKLFIVFMPAAIVPILLTQHRIINTRIKSLHAEVIYDIVRCKMVNTGFRVFMKVIGYFLGFLDEQEKRAFKDGLVQEMDGNPTKPMFISKDPKTFEQKEVQCTLITPVSLSSVYKVPPIPSRTAKEERFQSKNLTEDRIHQGKGSRGSSAVDSAFKKGPKSPEFMGSKIPPLLLPPVENTGKELFRSIPIAASNKKLDLPEQQLVKPVAMRRSATDAALNEFKDLNQKPAKLIDQLNMSVSEYSDLMDIDEELEGQPNVLQQRKEEKRQKIGGPLKIEKKVVQSKGGRDVHYTFKEPQTKRPQSPLGKLITKVQSYVQMGSRTYPRLQKYYAELYPSDRMQIVSMHGRVFQKHTLKFMKRQENDYYEMHFAEQTMPNVRVIKFKADMGQFSRYLQA